MRGPRGSRLVTGSLQTRTIVSVLALLAVLLFVLIVVVDLVLGSSLRAQIEQRLEDRANTATALIGTVDSDDLAERLSIQGVSVRIQGTDGNVIVAGPAPDQLGRAANGPGRLPGPIGSAGLEQAAAPTIPTPTPAPTAQPKSASQPESASQSLTDSGDTITLASTLSDGSQLTLVADATSVEDTLVQLRWIMGGTSAAVLGIAALGLLFVVRGALKPLDRMTAVARSIAHGDRGRRLRPTRTTTEIGRVAGAFDEMLDAVEGAEQNAVAAEARVRTFVSDAAHELRTPIAGIRAAAETLVRTSVSSHDREVLASHVARESGRASRLIDDMLLMARVDRGLELRVRRVDASALLRSEAGRLQLRHPQFVVTVEAPPGPVLLSADPDRLAQVFGNLIDNAARATAGRGSATVTVRELPVMSQPASRAAGATAARTVVIDVLDDGPGVPETDRQRIFDRLVRLDTARNREGGGVGLGLPIARGIARAHGGDLTCEPVAAPDRQAPDRQAPQRQTPHRPAASGALFRLTLPGDSRAVGAAAAQGSGSTARPTNSITQPL